MAVYPLSPIGVKKAERLFGGSGINETMILSALQGCMGVLHGDHPDDPSAVRATVLDFAFFAGDADTAAAEELIRTVTAPLNAALQQETGRWKARFLAIHPGAQTFDRYAIKKEPDVFDKEKLSGYLSLLPEGYALVPMEEQYYRRCLEADWSRDLVAGFRDWEAFAAHGLGWLAIAPDGSIAAGASTYSWYKGGIEIEIDTSPAHRRKKLALVTGARLILDCLSRGLYPSWDAANLASVALAEKLGYHLDHHYNCWYLPGLDADGGAAVDPRLNLGKE